MAQDIDTLLSSFRAELSDAADSSAHEALRIKYLGKKGAVTALLKQIATVAPQERKAFGQRVNELKQTITTELDSAATKAGGGGAGDRIDVHMPGRSHNIGTTHPLSLIRTEILKEFNQMGFLTVDGPEIEQDYYNFEALNIPADHPARDSQDSFYLKGDYLLRTQTSPVQIRIMEKVKPPVAVVSPGRVYRRDTVDATHSPIFHQIEGLYVDRGVTFADLKGILVRFCKNIFGSDVGIRFRPDYFPFTEPSCEIAIHYRGRWLEILGAGMVNPVVLKNVKIDPSVYTGLAFGLGIDRVAMIKYGIDDIRYLFENNYKFLRQFN